jgi:hypothetical protein
MLTRLGLGSPYTTQSLEQLIQVKRVASKAGQSAKPSTLELEQARLAATMWRDMTSRILDFNQIERGRLKANCAHPKPRTRACNPL